MHIDVGRSGSADLPPGFVAPWLQSCRSSFLPLLSRGTRARLRTNRVSPRRGRGSQVTAWCRLRQDMDSSGPLHRGGGWALPAEINRCVADPAGADPYRETIFL